VCGGLAEGNLTEDHEGWRWGEPRSLIPSFDAVIESVFRLSPDERVVVELLAISDPLEALVLERLTVPSAVLALERRGLIEVTTDRHRVAARMSGSISADLVRAATPPLAARALRRSLADVLTSVGGRRRGDLPRLVSMRLDAGEAPDVEDLMNAAEKVLELFDPAVGERLARRAVEAEAGPRASRLLALALFDLGRGDEVEALLVATDQEARSEEDIVATALIRAQNLFFRLQQPAAAFEVLAKADADLTSEARHRRLGALRGELLMWSDSITRVIDDVERQQPVDGPQAAPWRLSMSALARAYSGQPELALASLDDADDPWANAVSRQWSRWWALWLSGRIREAHTTAESFYAAAGDDEIARRYPASWPMMLGYALLLRGRPLSAGRFLREAISLGTDRAGFRHLCLTLLAQSYALTGETTEARTALARAGELHNPSLRSHQYELSLAEAWVAASEGRVDLAVERALAAAQAARTLGQRPFEADLSSSPIGSRSSRCTSMDGWPRCLPPTPDLSHGMTARRSSPPPVSFITWGPASTRPKLQVKLLRASTVRARRLRRTRPTSSPGPWPPSVREPALPAWRDCRTSLIHSRHGSGRWQSSPAPAAPPARSRRNSPSPHAPPTITSTGSTAS